MKSIINRRASKCATIALKKMGRRESSSRPIPRDSRRVLEERQKLIKEEE